MTYFGPFWPNLSHFDSKWVIFDPPKWPENDQSDCRQNEASAPSPTRLRQASFDTLLKVYDSWKLGHFTVFLTQKKLIAAKGKLLKKGYRTGQMVGSNLCSFWDIRRDQKTTRGKAVDPRPILYQSVWSFFHGFTVETQWSFARANARSGLTGGHDRITFGARGCTWEAGED